MSQNEPLILADDVKTGNPILEVRARGHRVSGRGGLFNSTPAQAVL